MLEKNESVVTNEEFSNVAKLFLLYFCAPKTKSTSQAQIKFEIFVNLRPKSDPNSRPEPDPKNLARLTSLLEQSYCTSAQFLNTHQL